MFINAICFNIAWFGCVLIGNAFVPVVLVWLITHLYVCEHKNSEFLFVILVTAFGTLLDSTLMHINVFMFKDQSTIVPLWLIFIWLSFALTLNGYLAFLQKTVVLQVLSGFILAPLSYLAGNALGAVQFGYSAGVTLFILSVCWSILLPFLYFLNRTVHRLFRAHYHAQAL